jgi:ATP-dependent helicase HrpA
LGSPIPKTETEAFREQLLSRVVDEAYGLRSGIVLPKNKAEFQRLLDTGTPRLTATFDVIVRYVVAASVELDKALRALDGAAKQPSGAAVSADLRSQLEQLFPLDLLAQVELVQLAQYPRYLRAAQTRLARAIVDPRKDAGKAERLVPLWKSFLVKQSTAQDRSALARIHWALEELRVGLFAPELKPAQVVTVESIAAALLSLR